MSGQTFSDSETQRYLPITALPFPTSFCCMWKLGESTGVKWGTDTLFPQMLGTQRGHSPSGWVWGGLSQ